MKKAGLVIFVIGVLLTIFTAISFFTKEKVVDLGKVEISAKKEHNIIWSPILGVVVMGIGGVVLLASKK